MTKKKKLQVYAWTTSKRISARKSGWLGRVGQVWLGYEFATKPDQSGFLF